MLELLILICFFWFPILMVIWRNILWDLYLWQVKEYRFDRMISHLLSQEEDLKQSTLVYVIKVGSLFLLILYLLFPTSDVLLVGALSAFGIYVYEALKTTQETIGRRLVRPKFSVRNILVLVPVLFVMLIPFMLVLFLTLSIQKNFAELAAVSDIANDLSKSVYLLPYTTATDIRIYPSATLALLFSSILGLMIDLITPLLVSFFVVLTEPFSQFRRYFIIRDAKRKIAANKNLKIIGVTGSYGKTTTKEILYQILSQKFKTVKTPKNYNSAVGIAISINSLLKKDTEVFIAEMGAYTKNEVKDAAEIAPPDVSIVTGIDSQHITLFGSIENIVRAKYEIIANAKKDATVILNGDNEYCIRMAEMTDKKKILYFTSRDKTKILSSGTKIKVESENFPTEHTLFAFDIKRHDKGIEFSIKQDNKSHKLKTNIHGPHNVSNILAAIGSCMVVGMKLEEIVDLINDTKFEVPYLNRLNGLNSTVILDDGYNANSTGFLAALDELSSIETTKRKIIMTKGIIELGWEKEKVYEKISKRIVKVSNSLLTSDKLLHDKIKSVDPAYNSILVKGTTSFIKEYNRNTQPGDVILIEGPMNPQFLNDIIDKD